MTCVQNYGSKKLKEGTVWSTNDVAVSAETPLGSGLKDHINVSSSFLLLVEWLEINNIDLISGSSIIDGPHGN